MVDAEIIRSHCFRRNAITVIEVLFAMLVAVIGLLGIASVLPLAARNARESNGFNFVHSAGSSWFQEFSTRGLNNYAEWSTFRDFAPVGFVSMAPYTRFSRAGAISGAAPGVNESPTNSTINRTNANNNRIWNHQAICIDPVFLTEPAVVSQLTAPQGAYRPSVFPYYQDGFSPTEDAFQVPAAPNGSAWEDQPRMIRVTLNAMSGGQVNRQLAQMLFTANDDFTSIVNEKEGDIPATRLFSNGKAISDRKYSWMATLSPREPLAVSSALLETDYHLSIVIFQNRDLSWFDSSNISTGQVENKPSGERLVWVYPLSGDFQSGNGGRVRLISNSATDDKVSIGDWIMLGKHYQIQSGVPANRYAYFRWFRIVATSAEAKRGPLSDFAMGGTPLTPGNPYGVAGTTEVWARDVVLEGPDWTFYSTKPVPPAVTPIPSEKIGSIYVPTTGTLMKNVITVIDRSTIIP